MPEFSVEGASQVQLWNTAIVLCEMCIDSECVRQHTVQLVGRACDAPSLRFGQRSASLQHLRLNALLLGAQPSPVCSTCWTMLLPTRTTSIYVFFCFLERATVRCTGSHTQSAEPEVVQSWQTTTACADFATTAGEAYNPSSGPQGTLIAVSEREGSDTQGTAQRTRATLDVQLRTTKPNNMFVNNDAVQPGPAQQAQSGPTN